MSSTSRGAERAPSDNYPTPPWVVDRLLDRVALPGGHWLEPCAGEGGIIRAVNSQRSDVQWTAVELRDVAASIRVAAVDPSGRTNPNEHRPCSIHVGQDFLTWDVRASPVDRLANITRPAFDVVLTNPPYSLARAFIDKCLTLAPIVAMPLRLNFLGSEERSEWFGQVGVPDVYVLPNRPDFSGLGGDSCEYAWMVWDRRNVVGDPPKVQILDVTPRSVRIEQRPRPAKEIRGSA